MYYLGSPRLIARQREKQGKKVLKVRSAPSLKDKAAIGLFY
uniref:Uncharacterized protein n=1 Tax=Candidozyma auris TaxID=498019 RepID=A0A0L0NNV4_CANAR